MVPEGGLIFDDPNEVWCLEYAYEEPQQFLAQG